MSTTNQTQQTMFSLSRRHRSAWGCISIEPLKRRERAGILIPLKLGRGVRYRITDIERLEQQAEVRR